MKTTIISWENAHENDLVYDTMKAYETDDILSFFEGDPDRLYIDGECILFIDIKNYLNKNQTVIFLDGSYSVSEDKIQSALTKFYNNECISVEIEQEADIWYRGGMGYSYSLYKLN